MDEYIFENLCNEREYQKKKWGNCLGPGQFVDLPKSVGEFILYMEHHLTKARELASTQSSTTPSLHELRKVAALAIACFEQHGVPPRAMTDYNYIRTKPVE